MNYDCYSCWYCDVDVPCCMYIDKEKHTRGEIVNTIHGRKIVYPERCDKWRPRDNEAGKKATKDTAKSSTFSKPLQDFPERTALYNDGLSDAEIAARLHVTVNTIGHWRRMRGLPPHFKPVQRPVWYPDREQLYREGLSDGEIAERLGERSEIIRSWRNRRGYPPHPPKVRKCKPCKDYPERDRLYAEGFNDTEIARRLGVKASSIFKWRQLRGLPSNYRKGEKR